MDKNEECKEKFGADACGPMWFKVQICVSKEREAAERLARRLREDGYNAYVVADDRD
ncbi:MAG: hypothetical protein RR135_01565 [Oscillospiraceae bacterium]